MPNLLISFKNCFLHERLSLSSIGWANPSVEVKRLCDKSTICKYWSCWNCISIIMHNYHENTIYHGNFHLLEFDVCESVVVCLECEQVREGAQCTNVLQRVARHILKWKNVTDISLKWQINLQHIWHVWNSWWWRYLSASYIEWRVAISYASDIHWIILLVLDVHSYVSMRQSISDLGEQREAFSSHLLAQRIVFHRLHTNAKHNSVLAGSVEGSYVVILKLPGSLFASRDLFFVRHRWFPQQRVRFI